jgi:uncharacterized membrane protein YhaH (DUF805 family)
MKLEMNNQVEQKNTLQYFFEGYTKNYVNFTGRARRKEYWSFTLLFFVSLFGSVYLSEELSGDFDVIPATILLGSFLPGLSMGVRRMHDIGKSGTNLLVYFIPLIGAIWFLILMTTEGQKHRNKYGPDPKQPDLGNELDQIGVE